MADIAGGQALNTPQNGARKKKRPKDVVTFENASCFK
jgi:hypothetical protein